MDRRLTPFSGRVAHVSLKGKLAPEIPLTEGEAARVAPDLAFLHASPGGAVDRQLIHGAAVTVIDRSGDHAFVMAERDGYCGWISRQALTFPRAASHRVATPKTHLYPEPKVQAPPVQALYLNALVTVTGEHGSWAETPEGFVPLGHLRPVEEFAEDPVAVATLLLHAPYLWAGNSVAGVDCSGLAQLAFHAAGMDLPGDSDLQAQVGREIAAGEERRGDLIFWKGHVALVAGEGQILHANGHSMSVAHEGLVEAIARIEASGGGPVTARRRLRD